MQRALNILFNTRLKGGISLAIVQIVDFGKTDGVQVFRINGDKVDLERIVQECRDEDAEFSGGEPEVVKTHQTWTLLLKVKLPVKTGEKG